MSVALFCACDERDHQPLEAVSGATDVSRFALTSLKGTRDGDRLDVRAVYSEGTKQLILTMRFAVGSPTRLESGTWRGLDSAGAVAARSVTFLGGQSGSPSLGGRFDLMGPVNRIEYRATIPLQVLNERL